MFSDVLSGKYPFSMSKCLRRKLVTVCQTTRVEWHKYEYTRYSHVFTGWLPLTFGLLTNYPFLEILKNNKIAGNIMLIYNISAAPISDRGMQLTNQELQFLFSYRYQDCNISRNFISRWATILSSTNRITEMNKTVLLRDKKRYTDHGVTILLTPPPPPVNRLTDRYKNITFLILRNAVGNELPFQNFMWRHLNGTGADCNLNSIVYDWINPCRQNHQRVYTKRNENNNEKWQQGVNSLIDHARSQRTAAGLCLYSFFLFFLNLADEQGVLTGLLFCIGISKGLPARLAVKVVTFEKNRH